MRPCQVLFAGTRKLKASCRLFAVTLIRGSWYSSELRWIAIRSREPTRELSQCATLTHSLPTVIATSISMCSSTANMIVFVFIHGKEMGWMCLALCTLDTLINASVLVAVRRFTCIPGQRRLIDRSSGHLSTRRNRLDLRLASAPAEPRDWRCDLGKSPPARGPLQMAWGRLQWDPGTIQRHGVHPSAMGRRSQNSGGGRVERRWLLAALETRFGGRGPVEARAGPIGLMLQR